MSRISGLIKLIKLCFVTSSFLTNLNDNASDAEFDIVIGIVDIPTSEEK